MIWAKYAAVLGVIAILYAVYWGIDNNGYDRGSAEVQVKWDKERAQIAEELRVAAEKNQKTIQTLEDTKNENLDTIADLRIDLARARVRVPQAPCPGLDTSAGGADTTTGTGQQYEAAQNAFDEFRLGLESDAEETDKLIESCRVVMDWAKSL